MPRQSRVTFGLSGQVHDGHSILRYDLMSHGDSSSDGKLVEIVDRSRFYLHVKNVGNSIKVTDLDFWALHSDQTKFVIDQVSGGDVYSLMGGRNILEIKEEGPEINNIFSKCLNQESCHSREIRLPSMETIYELGAKGSVIESMEKVLDDNQYYVHHRAHFGLTPNPSVRHWREIEGSIAYTESSMMNSHILGDSLYLTGGNTFINQLPESSQDALKINLRSLSVEKVLSENMPEDIIDEKDCSGEMSFSGIYQDRHIFIEFGGFGDTGLSNTGKIKIKNETPSCDDDEIFLLIDEVFFEENGFDPPAFEVFSPVVVFTGQHVIIYGGLHYTSGGEVASVNSGFVVDIDTKRGWAMSTYQAPHWITKGVWANDRMIAWGGFSINYEDIYPNIKAHGKGGIYSLSTNSWEPMPKAPIKPRLGHQLIWSNDRLLVFSGQDKFSNVDGHPPSFVPGASLFYPGTSFRIYFTERYALPRKVLNVNTDSGIGLFYLEGSFSDSANIEVHQGASCRGSNMGEYPSVAITSLGFGKREIAVSLKEGNNVVSVLVEEGENSFCTNVLSFMKD